MTRERAEQDHRDAAAVIRPLLEKAHAGWRARNVVDARASEDIKGLWRELQAKWREPR